LKNFENYFSRHACLHFIGNNTGKKAVQNVGWFGIVYLGLFSIPAALGILHEIDFRAGQAGLEEKNKLIVRNPHCSHLEKQKAFEEGYNRQITSYTLGRMVYKSGIVGPGTLEGRYSKNSEVLQILEKEF